MGRSTQQRPAIERCTTFAKPPRSVPKDFLLDEGTFLVHEPATDTVSLSEHGRRSSLSRSLTSLSSTTSRAVLAKPDEIASCDVVIKVLRLAYELEKVRDGIKLRFGKICGPESIAIRVDGVDGRVELLGEFQAASHFGNGFFQPAGILRFVERIASAPQAENELAGSGSRV